jgi:hypothetical protein
VSKAAELTHLFRVLKAPAAAKALPKLAERARHEEWSYERFAEALLQTEVGSICRSRSSTGSARMTSTWCRAQTESGAATRIAGWIASATTASSMRPASDSTTHCSRMAKTSRSWRGLSQRSIHSGSGAGLASSTITSAS